VYTVKSGD